ncbi:30S ribosomal protein S9 [Candidatus Azambacteria bacterium]|nr:30S ribosomal protein S9 [Candidatus Azambacteria bacterium]MBI3684799.1 30S ribosomal protein S9 [Candidatus Azambacteria bacterium]
MIPAPVVEAGGVKETKSDRYFEGIGRRKTAHARVRIYTKGTGITINGKECASYFPGESLQRIVNAPLVKMKSVERMRVSAFVQGGGIHAQAEAIRHGIARALVAFNPDFRKRLKRALYLKRDARMKETKKYGLKKARKAPRWSKR